MSRPTNVGVINHYYCEECDIEWEDEWDCECDDECPGCRRDFTPEYSERLDEESPP